MLIRIRDKEKVSHSLWYQHGGDLHNPSRYLYQVPASVAKEAWELQAIRHKLQNDKSSGFSATNYATKEGWMADHDNVQE